MNEGDRIERLEQRVVALEEMVRELAGRRVPAPLPRLARPAAPLPC
jgi:hypothetical protein